MANISRILKRGLVAAIVAAIALSFAPEIACNAEAAVVINPKALQWAYWKRETDAKIGLFRDLYRMAGSASVADSVYKELIQLDSSEKIIGFTDDMLSKIGNIKPGIIGDTLHSMSAKWYWFTPTKNGILFMKPEDLEEETRKTMKKLKSYGHLIQLDIPVEPDDSPFFQKALEALRKGHPMARWDSVKNVLSVYVTPTISDTRTFLERTQKLLISIGEGDSSQSTGN